MEEEQYDCIIIGAGLSGIDVAYHVQVRCPDRSFCILERRNRLGGTWDFFRYPGTRCDSDMFTLGFSFKPWVKAKSIAGKHDILTYLEEAADEFRIRERIRFNTHVVDASWSSADACWRLTSAEGDLFRCSFLISCGGFYRYDCAHQPNFPGLERFRGRVIHPQFWTAEDDACYDGKHVAVIGSGATAVTLVPAMAAQAAHVTMVQRTPTYMWCSPTTTFLSRMLFAVLPASAAAFIMRLLHIIYGCALFQVARTFPDQAKKLVLDKLWEELRGSMSEEEFRTHFTPPYNLWDQRVCVTPDGDLFKSIREGRTSVVTGTVEAFTETGIQMLRGPHIDADVVVTATGLAMQPNFPMSMMRVMIDGKEYTSAQSMVYRNGMLSNVPNFAFSSGYTTLSWTLRVELMSGLVCRILNHMSSKKLTICFPRSGSMKSTQESIHGLSSGYLERSRGFYPKQGVRSPWRVSQNYLRDCLLALLGRVDDPHLEFLPASSSSAGDG